VDVLRMSPQSQHMMELIALWREALMDGKLSPQEAQARMAPLLPAHRLQRLLAWQAGMAQRATTTA
jgi:hypothetical protein